MSHTIAIRFEDKELYLNRLNDIHNQLNKINERMKTENLEKFTFQEFNEIKELQLTLINRIEFRTEELMDIQHRISTLESGMQNIRALSKFKIDQDLIRTLEDDFNLPELIKLNGILAIEAFEYLNNNNITKNIINFNDALEVIKNTKMDKLKIDEYIKNSFEIIDENELDDNLKYEMKKWVKNLDNVNDFKDANAIIQSKINEYGQVVQFTKKLVKILSNQNFKLIKSNYQWSIDEYTNIVLKISMKNSSNNTIDMHIKSNNELSYKLGNYVGHACEKTTAKIIKDLEALGINHITTCIKRDYENNPNYKNNSLKQGE